MLRTAIPVFFLISLLPGLLFAENAWPPIALKPVAAELSTSFSSFFPSSAPTPELTVKMVSTWLIKPMRITDQFVEVELTLKSGFEKTNRGGNEVEQAVGHLIPPEEQIPYFMLLNSPIAIHIFPNGTFEIMDKKKLSPIQKIAQQQRNLIKVLLLFFPFNPNQPITEGKELLRSGDEMSFKISKISDNKIFATILDYREMSHMLKPSKPLYSKRKRWGTMVWNRHNIFLCQGEVFSEREFEAEQQLQMKIRASANFSSKLLEK